MALGSPGMADCGGIFISSRGFVRGCYYSPLYEAELWAVMKGVCFVRDYGWDYLWIKSWFYVCCSFAMPEIFT